MEKEYQKAIITISKAALAKLPSASFLGKICVIDKPDQVAPAVEDLRAAGVIGFDTETRPSFRKGQHYKVALVQLSTPSHCYLFRTNILGFPQELVDILEDETITKVGLSINDDFLNIRKLIDLNPQGFVDLQSYVKQFKIVDASLSRLYALIFGQRISKGQRLTNWEAPVLSPSQQKYAALDANACIKIYNRLEKGTFNPKNSPYLTIPSEPENQIPSNDSETLNPDTENQTSSEK